MRRGDEKTTRFPYTTPLMAGVTLLLSAVAFAQPSRGANWLDRPLNNWNTGGAALVLPSAAARTVDRESLGTRCQIPAVRSPGQRALDEAGWTAYDHLDRTLVQGDVEIVAGMIDADAACRPAGFQLFVFVGGTFAGTLSPETMITGQDASAGAVRLVAADTITAEFARYGNRDMPCCPTSRVTVRYRIDRSGSGPIVVPLDIRTTRSHEMDK